MDRMTHTCESITFLQLPLRTVIKYIRCLVIVHNDDYVLTLSERPINQRPIIRVPGDRSATLKWTTWVIFKEIKDSLRFWWKFEGLIPFIVQECMFLSRVVSGHDSTQLTQEGISTDCRQLRLHSKQAWICPEWEVARVRGSGVGDGEG